METCSSGEELVVKMRKPYTITKQRERWTDEEHNQFLEALKLYGRAWQRIEEHIGTKTAVQIRSHAQKFFSKLEKEALIKGIPLGQAHNIDIPPPRPKRKPSNPYPRKTCKGGISSSGESISSSCPSKDVLHLEKDAALEKPAGTETTERMKGTSDNSSSLEVLTLFHDAPCASVTSVNKSSGNAHIFREFVPFLKEIEGKPVLVNASTTLEEDKDLKHCAADYTGLSIGTLERLCTNTQTKQTLERNLVGHGGEEIGISSNNEPQGSQNSPKPVPMHFVDENNEKCGQATHGTPTKSTSVSDQAAHYAYPNLLANPSMSASKQHTNSPISSIHQLPSFPPFTLFHNNEDAYRYFVNISSTFSNMIISALLQNPAAHAAASLAASFWPSLNAEMSMSSTSETLIGGIPASSADTPPSMAAIAAATVAAATAWWATHGFFPLCHPPLPTGLAFASGPTTTNPTTEAMTAPKEHKEMKDDDVQIIAKEDQQVLDPEPPEGLITERSTSKSSPLSSSDSDQSGRGERLHGTELKASGINEFFPMPVDSDKKRCKKEQDRSSCGSNTPSSSEETDFMLENLDETREELKQTQLTHPPAGETSTRRSKSSWNINESWKEVSEEGRLAFQALFFREVLPQSFSSPHAEDAAKKFSKEKVNSALLVDLNSKALADSEFDHGHGINESPRSSEGLDKSLSMNENGHGKLKARRTGFKPYKRCSVEAKESKPVAGEEKGSKRIRMEGEASI